ncbi:GNAT family N-acetyltransferase [Streptomyces sp. NPDC048324]|uniref:GNAT family N-acetyltransferase n=1 Tax=Streptomyces sp. NPDC048324 TaxID=3157205 RepID=UPI0034236FF3
MTQLQARPGASESSDGHAGDFSDDRWGRGLATEAARAAVGFGFEVLGLERIVSVAQVGNGASERIMAKLGMHLVREAVDPGCGRRVRVFSLACEERVTATD